VSCGELPVVLGVVSAYHLGSSAVGRRLEAKNRLVKRGEMMVSRWRKRGGNVVANMVAPTEATDNRPTFTESGRFAFPRKSSIGWSVRAVKGVVGGREESADLYVGGGGARAATGTFAPFTTKDCAEPVWSAPITLGAPLCGSGPQIGGGGVSPLTKLMTSGQLLFGVGLLQC
jgi:hypothetical protein